MKKIIVDCLGSDAGEDVVHLALANFAAANKDVSFVAVGQKNPQLPNTDFVPTKTVLKVDYSFLDIARLGQDSSMVQAFTLAKQQKADGVLSFGSTTGMIFWAKKIIETLPAIKKPVIVKEINKSLVLDLGAAYVEKPEDFLLNALIGSCFCKVIQDKINPSIALLNIGTEIHKGPDNLIKAAQLLKDRGLNYQGFIESDKILKNPVDIIITDGFTGNMVLKAVEGTISFLSELIKANLKNIQENEKIEAWQNLFKSIDNRKQNGAPLLGLKQLVVKGHGGSDIVGMEAALAETLRLAKARVVEKFIAGWADV